MGQRANAAGRGVAVGVDRAGLSGFDIAERSNAFLHGYDGARLAAVLRLLRDGLSGHSRRGRTPFARDGDGIVLFRNVYARRRLRVEDCRNAERQIRSARGGRSRNDRYRRETGPGGVPRYRLASCVLFGSNNLAAARSRFVRGRANYYGRYGEAAKAHARSGWQVI